MVDGARSRLVLVLNLLTSNQRRRQEFVAAVTLRYLCDLAVSGGGVGVSPGGLGSG